jgi:hypothetical protein
MTNHTKQPAEINSLPCPLYQHGFSGPCEVCGQRADCILLSIFSKVECLEKTIERLASEQIQPAQQ